MNFVSLHNRSAYSFGSALTEPKQLARFAKQHGMPAIALTDLNGLYAAVMFQHACRKLDIKPIIGTELQVFMSEKRNKQGAAGFSLREATSSADAPVSQRTPLYLSNQTPLGMEPAQNFGGRSANVTLLAQNSVGYGNLCRLVSLRHLRDGPPQHRINTTDLCEHAAGLICLVGRSSDEDTLRKLIASLAEVFAGRLYVELAIHTADDTGRARRRARVADTCDIPVVASSDSRCLKPEQAWLLRALSSVGTLTLLDQPHPDKPEGKWHLRTPDEMRQLFSRRPDALASTLEIAEQCDFEFEFNKNRFPAFRSPDGRSAAEHLRELSLAGCKRRYIIEPPQRGIGGDRPTWDQVTRRLERELRIIEQVGYAEYFLVFHEIVEYCRSQNIDSLARGSAADSLVCYALGVSHACPFRFDLPFDRFINTQRAKFSKLADIDLDLPWDKREQVIRWVYDRWGHDRVAMIGSANTYHTRAAVVELGKVLGLPPHEIHRASKRMQRDVPERWAVQGAASFSLRDRSRKLKLAAPYIAAQDVPLAEEPYQTILRMADKLSGLPRHWAMHPCGVVVSPEPLTDLVPVQKSSKGFLVAQYDMDAIEDLGFIKIDLLGQAGLSVLRDAVAEIERTDGVSIDLQKDVDYSDAATWDMIATGRARGVHHIESPAMTSLLQQCNCRDIDCLTAIVAVIRPGAANQGKKDSFARRYQGVELPEFAHPALEPILRKTYGLMVFEEHILQVATEFAGLNLGAADVLRRALNKQDPKMICRMKREFCASARVHGRGDDEIDTVWRVLEGFSGFMFNKAHSAEYAVEAFQGAWLKHRWPAQYIAAILSNYRGFYAHSPTLPQIVYVLEAYRSGAGFLPPCVNRSRQRFSVCYVPRMQCLPPTLVGGRVARNSLCEPASAGLVSTIEARLKPAASLVSHPENHRLKSVANRRSDKTDTHRPMIRLPVSHINGLSEKFIEQHLAERRRGAFAGLADFMERCRPGKADAQLLLDSGALDQLGDSRPALFWKLRGWARQTDSTEPTLWSGSDLGRRSEPPVTLTPPDRYHIAEREKELLGFPISVDPLTHLSTDEKGRCIDWSRFVPVGRLMEFAGKCVQVCGLMVADRVNSTQQGELMKFVTLADRSGVVEMILFPDVYQRFGYLTVAHPILVARGRVKPFENRNGLILQVQQVSPPQFVAGPLIKQHAC